MKRIVACAVLALSATVPAAARAQAPAIVAGRVTDASGAPVATALVRIEALSVGTTTRADGQYRLVLPASRLPADTRQYVVLVTHQGLAPATRDMTLAPGDTTSADFTLAAPAAPLHSDLATLPAYSRLRHLAPFTHDDEETLER